MKKGAKITLILTSIILAASLTGSIILFAVYGSEAASASGWTFSLSGRNENVSCDQTESIYLGDREKITISETGCKVVMKTYREEKVKAELKGSYWGSKGNAPKIEVSKKNNEIEISTHKSISERTFGIHFGTSNSSNVTLTVFIPESYTGKLEIKESAGKIEIFTNGDSPALESLSIKESAGKVTAKGTLKNIDISECAGRVEIETDADVEKITVSECAGRVTLIVPEETQGKFEVSDCFGGFSSDFDYDKEEMFSYSGKMNGGGSTKIEISECAGKVELETK